ncbi:MAG: LysR family transcriptional regulator [Oligella ureolytica]|nr:LysR family transcriptional regulator [Oligella ureolytica]
MDRISSMRVFVRAASVGSISAAARHIGMSAAMATKHIDALELRLGVKLFHRTTKRRSLTLTEAGNHYLDACERILADIDEAEAAVSSQRIKANGLLRMNIPVSFGTRFIAPRILEFSHRHPEVKIELGLSDAQLDIIAGSWDLAIRIGQLEDSPLKTRRLGDSFMRVCASPDYLDNRGIPRSANDLTQHNCLSYTLSGMQNSEHWAFGKKGEYKVPISGDLVANSGDALLAAAVAGQGVIYQPHFIVGEALNQGKLVDLVLDKPVMDIGGIHVIYPPDRHPPAKVRVMIDYLVEVFGKNPP